MKTYFVVVSALLSTVSVSVAKADGLPQKYLPQPRAQTQMPQPPQPVKEQLPLNAKVNQGPNGTNVYVPTSKKGDVGITLQGAPKGEIGGSASLTIQTK